MIEFFVSTLNLVSTVSIFCSINPATKESCILVIGGITVAALMFNPQVLVRSSRLPIDIVQIPKCHTYVGFSIFLFVLYCYDL